MSGTASGGLGIDLVPRSSLNQFDVGFRWIGRNLLAVYRSTLPFAVAAGVLCWMLVRVLEWDLRAVLLVVAVVTWPLGIEFGRRLASEAFERTPRGNLFLRVAGPTLLNRFLNWGGVSLSLVLFEMPGWIFVGILIQLAVPPFLGLAGSFQPEDAVLDRKGTGRARRRTGELVKQERTELYLAMCGWTFLWLVLVVVALVGTEMALRGLFQWTVFLDRAQELWGRYDSGELYRFLYTSPGFAAMLAFWSVATYPFVRVPWSFAYVDLRIRRDMWDLQRRFYEEATRLEGPA